MLYVYNNTTKYFVLTVNTVEKFNKINVDESLKYTETGFDETDPTKFTFYRYDETNSVWVFDEDAYIKWKKENYLNIIKKVSSKLIDEAPYIVVPDIDRAQVDAYRVKYEQAKKNNTSFFEYEAKITGMAVEDLIQLVLQNGAIYEGEYNDLISRIEGMRRGAKLLTYGEKFENVDRALLFMKKLSKDLTYQMFLDYVAGLVDNIGDLAPLNIDGTPQITSVIDIIGFVPEETI